MLARTSSNACPGGTGGVLLRIRQQFLRHPAAEPQHRPQFARSDLALELYRNVGQEPIVRPADLSRASLKISASLASAPSRTVASEDLHAV